MLYFITNREILGEYPNETIREDGGEHAGDNLRFGTYDIESRKFELFSEPGDESDLAYSRANAEEATSLKGSTRFFTSMYRHLRDNVKDQVEQRHDVLFFIHGFDTNLDGIRNNFEDLNRRYVLNPDSPIKHIVIFTWPGKSHLLPLHYRNDKKDAIRSGETLARCVKKMMAFFKFFLGKGKHEACGGNIHLMVHSMGNRVLKHMMLELERQGKLLPEMFKEILLMASDVKHDIFEPGQSFHNLTDLGRRVHVYFHENDRVLDISKYTKNFSNRLGRYGRKRIDPTFPNIIDANVTKTDDDPDVSRKADLLNHWYYYSSTEVVKDVIRVLKGGDSVYAVR